MIQTSSAYPALPLILQTRSMGVKLILIGVLALLMTIPSLFVNGLVNERSQNFANATARAQSGTPGSTHIRMVDSYRSVDRSLKYVLLFLGLVFLTYFVFEVTTGKRVHPAQYVLVGTAQLIFYLLLLSIAEKSALMSPLFSPGDRPLLSCPPTLPGFSRAPSRAAGRQLHSLCSMPSSTFYCAWKTTRCSSEPSPALHR